MSECGFIGTVPKEGRRRAECIVKPSRWWFAAEAATTVGSWAEPKRHYSNMNSSTPTQNGSQPAQSTWIGHRGAAGLDLRSDTMTTPTPSMLAAIQSTTLLDDVFKEDPTTNELEDFCAKLTGKEAGLFVLSGTMGNVLGLRSSLSQPPYSILCDHRSHIFKYEAGGVTALTGAMLQLITPKNGLYMTLEDIKENIVLGSDIHSCPTRVISLENTLGGVVMPLEEARRIADFARQTGNIRVHCDGARLWEAVASGAGSLKEYGACFDTINLCFSKGLGAPCGSILVGPKDIIDNARWIRKSIGGGLRQSGVLTAAARVAVEETFGKGDNGEGGLLKHTHELAKEVAAMWTGLGGKLTYPVHTNMCWLDLVAAGISGPRFAEIGKEEGLKLGQGRIITHYQIWQNREVAIPKLKRVFERAMAEGGGKPSGQTVWGWGANLHYLYLVRIDVPALIRYPGRSSATQAPHHISTYRLAALLSTTLAATLLLFWALTRRDPALVVYYDWVPMTYLLVLAALFAVPLRGDAMPASGRRRLLATLRRVSLGGIAEAQNGKFGDILLADVLTSYAKVLADLYICACMFLTSEGSATARPDRGCGGAVVVPLILALPSAIRLRQCLIEYSRVRSAPYKESVGWGGQHLANAAKYSTAFPVIILTAMQRSGGSNDGGGEKDGTVNPGVNRAWLAAVVVQSLYTFYWDVAKDWDLTLFSGARDRNAPDQPWGLRRRMYMQPAPLVYYCVVALDFALRCTWVVKLSPGLDRLSGWEGSLFVLQLLEVLRRWIWIFFRVETEHIRNSNHVGLGVDDILLGNYQGKSDDEESD
ncbi:hypothetical protein PspLS_07525 [Pyricularia sp. CBS 133598]|nr:hypothetical protein PspLS_07525 [Pyricularia sp. CBS 133598]